MCLRIDKRLEHRPAVEALGQAVEVGPDVATDLADLVAADALRGETGTENRFPDGRVAALKCLGIAIGRGEFCPGGLVVVGELGERTTTVGLGRLEDVEVQGGWRSALGQALGLCLEQRNGLR